VSPLRLSEPLMCDMNCYKDRGHEGPHQKWYGDPCDRCEAPARVRVGTEALCRECADLTLPKKRRPCPECGIVLVCEVRHDRFGNFLKVPGHECSID
jgi:hypothetical protein